MIRISEIFGPVVQGEGAQIGVPTVFVRVGGCDYKCSWCDTMYAVDTKFAKEWLPMSDTEIALEIQRLSVKPILVTLSGGNPALYDFGLLIARMQEAGYRFTIETQGSVAKPWFGLLDHMTLSPKPPSSGMVTNYARLSECVSWLELPKVSFKIVVADDDDYEYAQDIGRRYPHHKIFLQVCNPMVGGIDLNGQTNMLLSKLQWLSNKVLADRWFSATVLPQLHVLMYGNKRGV
jgi:7-carboxy-7-deazaguanine synthase